MNDLHIRAAALMAFVGLTMTVTEPAEAFRFDLATYENADGANVEGLDLWVEVVDQGAFVSFIFANDSSISSSVSAIYFESTVVGAGLTSAAIVGESVGVDFMEGAGAAPPNPAPGQGGDALNWQGTSGMFAAVPPPAHTGIGHIGDEWLAVRWTYDGATYADVLAGLHDGSFRIAQHVTRLDPDNELSVWARTGEPVPLPAAVWLYGSGLLGMVGQHLARRRKRT